MPTTGRVWWLVEAWWRRRGLGHRTERPRRPRRDHHAATSSQRHPNVGTYYKHDHQTRTTHIQARQACPPTRSHIGQNRRLAGRPTAPHGAWRPLAVVSTPQPARPGEPPRWGRHQQLNMSSWRRLSEPSCGRHEATAGASSAGHRPLGRRPAPGCAVPAPTARPPTSWRCLPPRSAHP